jgi:hypothetical protein
LGGLSSFDEGDYEDDWELERPKKKRRAARQPRKLGVRRAW